MAIRVAWCNAVCVARHEVFQSQSVWARHITAIVDSKVARPCRDGRGFKSRGTLELLIRNQKPGLDNWFQPRLREFQWLLIADHSPLRTMNDLRPSLVRMLRTSPSPLEN